jgi:hypothetical protein
VDYCFIEQEGLRRPPYLLIELNFLLSDYDKYEILTIDLFLLQSQMRTRDRHVKSKAKLESINYCVWLFGRLFKSESRLLTCCKIKWALKYNCAIE